LGAQSWQKWVQVFKKIPNSFSLCVAMGVRKSNNQKNATMSYVLMFGDGRGPTHCNTHTWK
jgi:hypothetical protein